MHSSTMPSSTARRIDGQLERIARLYRLVDHSDPLAVRREATRRIKVTRAAGIWFATDARVRFTDVTVSGPAGPVPVRLYRPADGAGPRPVVQYLHGGAFISGDLDFEHPRCLEMCRETGFVVASVDYRLAPEWPYPAALDDCLAVFAWLLSDASGLDVDPARVALAGSSAGAALAAAACLKLRDGGGPLPGLQLLLYPVLDDRLETASMRGGADAPVWDRDNTGRMWRHYLGPERDGPVPPYASPARADDLSGLPRAYIMTAEHDPLRDEGAEYARRLVAAGVPTELHQFAGAFHGFDTLADRAPMSKRARWEHYAVLRDALHRPNDTVEKGPTRAT